MKTTVAPFSCVQKKSTNVATSSGEINVWLKDPYVNMENRVKYIEPISVAQNQKMRSVIFFMWTDEFQLSDEFQHPALPEIALPEWSLIDNRYMRPMEKLMLDLLDNKKLMDKALMK